MILTLFELCWEFNSNYFSVLTPKSSAYDDKVP